MAEILNLPAGPVQIALDYYGDYSDEIDERVDRSLNEADAAEAAWRKTQAALR